jgi:hypothetical protein
VGVGLAVWTRILYSDRPTVLSCCDTVHTHLNQLSSGWHVFGEMFWGTWELSGNGGRDVGHGDRRRRRDRRRPFTALTTHSHIFPITPHLSRLEAAWIAEPRPDSVGGTSR